MSATGVVRARLGAGARDRPALDERVFTRFPALMRVGTLLTLSLPLGSRLRRAVLVRNAELSYAAQNRRDWRFVVVPYGPRSEIHNVPITGGGAAVAVLQDRYHGRQGALQLLDDWTEPFEQTRFEPHELIDLGDGRVVILSRMTARGRRSGLEIDEPLAQLIEFRGGRLMRQRNWLGSWDEALEAAGLR